MHPDDRERIVAYLVDIGKQLNDLPDDDLSFDDRELRLHLMEVRDSLRSVLMASATDGPVLSPTSSAAEVG